MVDTNEAYKPSQCWILLVGLGSLVWARLKTVYLTTILGLENNNSFPTLKSLPAAARLPVIFQSKLLSTRQRPSAPLGKRPASEPNEAGAQLALAREPSSASAPREQPTNPTPALGRLHLDAVPSPQRCRNRPQWEQRTGRVQSK